MKKSILRISCVAVLVAAVAVAVFSCNKEKVVKESAETTEATLPQLYSCQSSINPFDEYAVGIKQYLEKVAILCENPWYEEHLEVFEQDAKNLTYLIQYPTLDKSICEKIDSKYLQSLLGIFIFDKNPETILINAIKAEEHVINHISDLKLQNTYLEIISISKYFVYYSLEMRANISWGQRLDNCVGWKLYDIFSSPVLTAIFLSDPIVGMAAIVADCSWFATFKPKHHVCQDPHPESANPWIDLD